MSGLRGWVATAGLLTAACTFGSNGGPGDTLHNATTNVDSTTTDEPGTDATSVGDDDSSGDDACEPGTVGCACAPECDGDLLCVQDVCTSPTCSDGTKDPDEQCDDGNALGGDGCEPDCTLSEGLAELAVGRDHTCGRVWDGTVKCWGEAGGGRLGYGMGAGGGANVGDDETPAMVAPVDVGEPVEQLCAAAAHTCAVLASGVVRCWGRGSEGRLGNAQTNDYGDDEPASQSPIVDLAVQARAVACGASHTCAIGIDDSLWCWGEATGGRLGLGMGNVNVGDDESVVAVGPVAVGGPVAEVALGQAHSCARLQSGVVKCWGAGAEGRLGYGNTTNIGLDETPELMPNVPLGEAAVELALGDRHSCARLQSGLVKCWGANDTGQLGNGTLEDRGDDELETPDKLFPLDSGEAVVDVDAGQAHTCIVLVSGKIKCWGEGDLGRLASEGTVDLLLPPTDGVAVDATVKAVSIGAGGSHTCARLRDGTARCWGSGLVGQLGYGNVDTLGDEPGETPDVIGPVPL